jgi:hypothetical protein
MSDSRMLCLALHTCQEILEYCNVQGVTRAGVVGYAGERCVLVASAKDGASVDPFCLGLLGRRSKL